jgi:hypothetical protein
LISGSTFRLLSGTCQKLAKQPNIAADSCRWFRGD